MDDLILEILGISATLATPVTRATHETPETPETLVIPTIPAILAILGIRHHGLDLAMTSLPVPLYPMINLIHHAPMSSLLQHLVRMELILLTCTIRPSDFPRRGPRLMRFPQVNQDHLCTRMIPLKGSALVYRMPNINYSKLGIDCDLGRKVHPHLQSLITVVPVRASSMQGVLSRMDRLIMVSHEACSTFRR